MKGFLLALSLSACATTSARGPTSGPPSATSADPSATDPDEVECKDEMSAGSTFPRQVCRTKLERDGDNQGAANSIAKPKSNPSNQKR